MTLNNEAPDGTDLAPDEAELSTISNLSVGLPGTVPEARNGDAPTAEQGEAPADVAGREAPPVPTPSRDGLNAEEVARLTGQDEATVDANNALDHAEGVVPDDED